VPNCHWAYFPEPRFPFYRVGSLSNAVTALAPPGCRSFTVEFSRCDRAISRPLEAEAVAGLRECGLISPRDELLFTFIQEIRDAYVVRDRQCEPLRRKLLAWLQDQGVSSIGRYGGWQYGSMEDAFLEGRKTALDIIDEMAVHAGR
jgi:hypothetical protein